MATVNQTRQMLSDEFLASLQEDKLPWQAVWSSTRPYNPVSGVRYKGINNLLLSFVSRENGYTDPRWCTFKQASAKGWSIKRGEKSTPVEYWSPYDPKKGRWMTWEEARELQRQDPNVQLGLRFRISRVFNASQIEGIPEYQPRQTDIGEIRNQRDTLLKNMQLDYREEMQGRAYYTPALDRVTLPPENTFDDTYGYMSTFLHECGHATGHASRLNRDLSGGFGSPEYAREELRAEISSAFTAQSLGLMMNEKDMEKHLNLHKAYIQNWISVLKDNPNELFAAIKDAEEISEYLLDKGEFKVEREPKYLEKPVAFEHNGLHYSLQNHFQRGGLLLNVTGKGAIRDLEKNKEFKQYRDQIVEVECRDGITEVGNRSFWGMKQLSRVTLPGTIRSIGFCAMDITRNDMEIEYHGSIEKWDAIQKEPDSIGQGTRELQITRNSESIILVVDKAVEQELEEVLGRSSPDGDVAWRVMAWDKYSGTCQENSFADKDDAMMAALAHHNAGATGTMVYDKLDNKILHIYGYVRDDQIPEDARPVIEVKEFRVKDFIVQGHALGTGIDEWSPVWEQDGRMFVRTGSVLNGNRMEHTFSVSEATLYEEWNTEQEGLSFRVPEQYAEVKLEPGPDYVPADDYELEM